MPAQHGGLVERSTDVAADERQLGGVDAQAVAQVEVRHPRHHATVGGDCRGGEIAGAGTGAGDGQHGAHHRLPLVEQLALACAGIAAHDPGAPEVGVHPAEGGGDVVPDDVALLWATARW
jgi:hypothetical protein